MEADANFSNFGTLRGKIFRASNSRSDIIYILCSCDAFVNNKEIFLEKKINPTKHVDRTSGHPQKYNFFEMFNIG